jgi:N-acetylneuraminate synthase
MSVLIIAEAGVNHNGDIAMAYQLVDAAVEAGADAIKFQTFKADKLVTKGVSKAIYQKTSSDTDELQYSMLKKLELSFEAHYKILDYCTKKDIQFLSTAFDEESMEFIVNNLGVETLKISSGDITNGPLLLAHAKTGKKLIISTGMASLKEVEEALGVVAFGMIDAGIPTINAFRNAYSSDKGQLLLQKNVTLLHCTTEYPAPYIDINLNAIQTMRGAFGLPVGYSDHSEGIVVSIAAVALGATLLEKHFTLDKMLPGPDHKASLEPNELREMIKAVRVVEESMGDGVKAPQPSEMSNRNVARKSIVASQNILSGDPFTKNNLTIKRSGGGVSPMNYWDLLGVQSSQSYKIDEVIN